MDVASILKTVLGNTATGRSPGGFAGGASGGGLGDLTKNIPGGLGGLAGGSLLAMILGSSTGRSRGGALLKGGGLAILAATAFKAYQDWQAKHPPGATTGPGHPPHLPSPPPAGSGFDLAEEKDQSGREMSLALVQAMISAAKSDGHLDGGEAERIQAQISQLGLGADEKGFLFDALTKPADAAAIARLPRTKEQASELYVASLVAIGDPDTAQEKAYLDRLAALLDLPPDLIQHLHAQVASVRGVVAT
jgi:uncharacterized membrane protein YebE (DUF533 family)